MLQLSGAVLGSHIRVRIKLTEVIEIEIAIVCGIIDHHMRTLRLVEGMKIKIVDGTQGVIAELR